MTQLNQVNTEHVCSAAETPVSDDTEFDRFVYLISHDLRACARALTVIPDWIEEDLEVTGGGAEITENVAMMKTHAQRLDQMLVDLLSYARVGRKQEFASFPVAELVDKALIEIGPDAHRKVRKEIQVEQVDLGEADGALLFFALISNAFKHSDNQESALEPSIEVRVDEMDGYCRIQVNDSGPGIPAKYCDKVLEPLSTLKPRDEVEGSGMGLAIVKKISSIYNGFLSWHENETATGLSLAVHLPLHQSAAVRTPA